MLARGFDAMSVAAIADGAGIGKGAVYLEFPGKHDILDAVLSRGIAHLNERVRTEVGEHPRLGEAYRASARALLGDPLMTAAFLDDRGVLGSHVVEVGDGRYRARHLGVVAWLRDLQDRGDIDPEIDPAAAALALSSATIGLLSAARLLGPLSPAELESAIDTLGRMAASFERG